MNIKSTIHHDDISAPYWYIGLMTERRVRSKAQDLTLIPLLEWEVKKKGNWRDCGFTLNITIDHGK